MTEQEAKNTKLSENFTLWEFLRTRHTELKSNQLQIPVEYIENLRLLCIHVLQPLRDNMGTIRINSGYRCRELNNRVLGARNSDHMYGFAADIDCIEMDKAFEYIKNNCKFKQLINEFDLSWIHVSYGRENLKQQILST